MLVEASWRYPVPINVRKESSEEMWSLQGFFTVSLLLAHSTLIIMIYSFLFGVKSVKSVSLIFSLKNRLSFKFLLWSSAILKLDFQKLRENPVVPVPALYVIMQFNVWGSKPSTRKKSMPLKSTHISSEIEIVENCTFYLKWHNIWYTLTLNERFLYNKFILVFTCFHQHYSSNVRYICKPHAARIPWSPLAN